MTFDEVKVLFMDSPNVTDWHVVPQEKSTIAYCLEDVALQLSCGVVRSGGVTHIQIQILYGGTIIMSWVAPGTVKRSKAKIDFAEALRLAGLELKKVARPKRN